MNTDRDENTKGDFICKVCYHDTKEITNCDYCEKDMCNPCKKGIENKYKLCTACHLHFYVWKLDTIELIDVKMGNAYICNNCNRIWDGNAQCDCYEFGWDELS